MSERLQIYLSKAGITSRRKSEDLIKAGKVMVNKRIITILGTKIDPEKDLIEIDGKVIKTKKNVYYAFNKPVGIICARPPLEGSRKGEKFITELVPNNPPVIPVGRLDVDSTGLILLTNDGDFAYKLTHPKFLHEKEYNVIVRCPSANALPLALERLTRGVRVNKVREEFDKIEVLSIRSNFAEIRVIIHTGKKRQIRRMVATVGLAVEQLKRVRIGKLHLGNLKPGEWRKIQPEHVIELIK